MKETNVTIGGPKLADYQYKEVVLKANLPFASLINDTNKKYIIKWDFDLEGGNVTIPANCTLDFQGGSVTNGTITLTNTLIVPNYNSLLNSNLNILGTIKEGTTKYSDRGLLVFYDSNWIGSIIFSLSNEVDSIPCDSTKSTLNNVILTTTARLYNGSIPVSSGVTINSIGDIAGVEASYSINEDGDINISWVIPADTLLTDDKYTSEINVSYNNKEYYCVFLAPVVSSGSPGVNPTVYQLFPQSSSIKFNYDAEEEKYTPDNIPFTMKVKGVTENIASIFDLDSLPSELSVYYKYDGIPTSSDRGTELTSSLTINKEDEYKTIGFALFKEDTIIDIQTIPIVRDGIIGRNGTSIIFDLDNELDSIIYDGNNNRVSSVVNTNLHLFDNTTDETSNTEFSIHSIEGLSEDDIALLGNALTITNINSDASIILKAEYPIDSNIFYYKTFIVKKLLGVDKFDLAVTPNAIGVNTSYTLEDSEVTIQVYRTQYNTNERTLVTFNNGNNDFGLTLLVVDSNGNALTESTASGDVTSRTFTLPSSSMSSITNVSVFLNKNGQLLDIETIPITTVQNGINGARGEDGTSIKIKASEADCEEVGEGYIDDNGHLQILTVLSPRAFQDAGEIRGPQGEKGDTGETGPQGIQGETGPLGETGATGSMGRMFYPAGTYSEGSYVRTSTLCPIVLYPDSNNINKYWYLVADTNLVVGGEYIAPGEDSSIWEEIPEFGVVFTEALFASYAKLGSWIFNNDYMFSQRGSEDGVNYDENYTSFRSEHSTWKPNIMFDARYGNGWIAGGKISWDYNGAITLSKPFISSFVDVMGTDGYREATNEIKLDENGIEFYQYPTSSSTEVETYTKLTIDSIEFGYDNNIFKVNSAGCSVKTDTGETVINGNNLSMTDESSLYSLEITEQTLNFSKDESNNRVSISNVTPSVTVYSANGETTISEGNIEASGNVTANQLIKTGGTSSQFLKADGSVDGTTYVPLSVMVLAIQAVLNSVHPNYTIAYSVDGHGNYTWRVDSSISQ